MASINRNVWSSENLLSRVSLYGVWMMSAGVMLKQWKSLAMCSIARAITPVMLTTGYTKCRHSFYDLNSLGTAYPGAASEVQAHLYKSTSWIPGFARDPLSRPLSPSLSRPSLPSLLFVPAFYPPSLGVPGFAQDKCIPEILFKPWSLVTLKFSSPLTPPPPPSDGVGWGLHVLVIFSVEFFFIDFLGSSWNFPHFWNFDPPTPPPRDAGPPGVGWVKICFIDFLDIHGSHWHWLRQRKRRHYVVGFIVTSFATQRLAEEAGS